MTKPVQAYPSREQAQQLLQWAVAQNPGPWGAHCQSVAYAAQTIAAHCGLDPDAAYTLGLLHDIGRYEGVRDLHHTYAGYALLEGQGFPAAARICLTHSFPVPRLEAYSGDQEDCTPTEQAISGRSLKTRRMISGTR